MSRPKPKIVHVRTKGGYYEELLEDRPIRLEGGAMAMLGTAKPGDEIEVFHHNSWVMATVMAPPKTYDFSVSCVSFENETEVWKALEKALTGFVGKRDSLIPWVKITPPSRKPGGSP